MLASDGLIAWCGLADGPTAAAVHAVQMRAYAQEAVLLRVRSFPPLERTVAQLQADGGHCAVARGAGAVVGAVVVEAAPEGGMLVGSLVVDPAWQRRGIGRALMQAVVARWGGGGLWVQTGVRNAPALALYAAAGFAPVAWRTLRVGSEGIDVVRLHRPAASA